MGIKMIRRASRTQIHSQILFFIQTFGGKFKMFEIWLILHCKTMPRDDRISPNPAKSGLWE